MADGERDAGLAYAQPHGDLSYKAFRQDYAVPQWKDSKGAYPRAPVIPHGAGQHLDKEIYWSHDVMRQEWEAIFSKKWLWVGHVCDLPKKGSFIKVDRGEESFLVIRGEVGDLSAFYNVCQHRGLRLVMQDFGNAKKFVCPFHRWEFGADGQLLKIADRETFLEEAICHDLNLKPLRVEAYRGWIFVNMDPEAEPLEEFLGHNFVEKTKAYEFDDLIRVRDVEQVWPCNWKVARELFMEGYHVQATHPQLVPAVDAYHPQIELFDKGHSFSIWQFMSPCSQYVDDLPDEISEEHKIFLREAGVPETDWPTHWRDVPRALIDAKKDKKHPLDYARFTEGQLIDDWNYHLFPCTEMFFHPEGYFVQQWLPYPGEPEKCIYQVHVYALPGMTELPSFMGIEGADLSGTRLLPRDYADADDMPKLGPVIRQDRMMVGRLQQGLHSREFHGSVYGEQEVTLRHFYTEYYNLIKRQIPYNLGLKQE